MLVFNKCGIRSLSWIFFRFAHKISLARPPLAAAQRGPAARFESLPALPNTTKPKHIFGFGIWCAGRDSNLRRHKSADLQSALVDRLSTDAFIYFVVPLEQVISLLTL